MPDDPLPPEQEFVAHLFAPLDGPSSDAAYQQVRSIWRRCADELGMRDAIRGSLPRDLPDSAPAAGPDGALAGCQDAAINYQAILRREHDVLNLSLAFADPAAAPPRRVRIGTAAPPGWAEFARWWQQLTSAGTDALLGVVQVFLAKSPPDSGAADARSAQVRAALPPGPEDAEGWWRNGHRTGPGFLIWEASAGGDRPQRRLVVLAGPEQDVEQSTYAWSSGGTELPPLGRYLMHAAKLRYQARIRGDGAQLRRLRERAETAAELVTGDLVDPGQNGDRMAHLTALEAAEAALAGTLESLRQMRRTVDIALDNMGRATAESLPKDTELGAWLRQQLTDDAQFLDALRQRAERVRGIALGRRSRQPVPPPPASSSVLSAPEPRTPRQLTGQVELRMGFGIDVIGYSGRSATLRIDAQRRVKALVERVIGDLGVQLVDTDRQDNGDGMNVVLPAAVELHRALPRLLHGWRDQLRADNEIHRDQLRLRLSVAVGLISRADIGFSGEMIVEIGRLLDSRPLRQAMADNPRVTVGGLVSDRLYEDVVASGYPGLSAAEFERVEVEVKSYRKPAWLWSAAAGGR